MAARTPQKKQQRVTYSDVELQAREAFAALSPHARDRIVARGRGAWALRTLQQTKR